MHSVLMPHLSHRDPGMLKELLSDNVFLYQGMNENVAVVVEVQTSWPDHERQLTWPCYVTSARAVYDRKAYVLVVAASRAKVDQAAPGSATAPTPTC
jgi:hypothetical protein